jgi:hypothetical protein
VKYLSPFLEVVPIVLLIAILAFVTGLLDSFFSNGLQLDGNASVAMLVAASICSACFGAIIIAVGATLCHSVLYRSISPFQSTIQRLWAPTATSTSSPEAEKEQRVLAYRRIIVDTYDDQLLNDACVALSKISHELDGMDLSTNALDEITDIFLFLLSPQATERSAVTAAQSIGEPRLSPVLFNV